MISEDPNECATGDEESLPRGRSLSKQKSFLVLPPIIANLTSKIRSHDRISLVQSRTKSDSRSSTGHLPPSILSYVDVPQRGSSISLPKSAASSISVSIFSRRSSFAPGKSSIDFIQIQKLMIQEFNDLSEHPVDSQTTLDQSTSARNKVDTFQRVLLNVMKIDFS